MTGYVRRRQAASPCWQVRAWGGLAVLGQAVTYDAFFRVAHEETGSASANAFILSF
jgi:hypothetical protein